MGLYNFFEDRWLLKKGESGQKAKLGCSKTNFSTFEQIGLFERGVDLFESMSPTNIRDAKRSNVSPLETLTVFRCFSWLSVAVPSDKKTGTSAEARIVVFSIFLGGRRVHLTSSS